MTAVSPLTQNPFCPGVPVRPPKTLYGRHADVATIVGWATHVRATRTGYHLYGGQGVGKSSLLIHVQETENGPTAAIVHVYVDLREFHNEDDWLLRQVASQMGRLPPGFSSVTRLRRALREEGGPSYFLHLDHFDEYYQRSRRQDGSESQGSERLCIGLSVLFGAPKFQGLSLVTLESDEAVLREFLVRTSARLVLDGGHKLPLLPDRYARDLIRTEGDRCFSRRDVEFILKYAGTHPSWIQRLSKELWDAYQLDAGQNWLDRFFAKGERCRRTAVRKAQQPIENCISAQLMLYPKARDTLVRIAKARPPYHASPKEMEPDGDIEKLRLLGLIRDHGTGVRINGAFVAQSLEVDLSSPVTWRTMKLLVRLLAKYALQLISLLIAVFGDPIKEEVVQSWAAGDSLGIQIALLLNRALAFISQNRLLVLAVVVFVLLLSIAWEFWAKRRR